MTWRYVCALLTSVTLVFGSRSLAQEGHSLADLDPAIRAVKVAGYWSLDGVHGRYRVVETVGGLDRLVTEVVVQWVADEPLEAGGRVVASRSLTDAGLATLTSVQWSMRGQAANRLQLELNGQTPDRRWIRYVFVLGRPGDIKLVMPRRP